MESPSSFAPIPGFVRVGWRNLFNGELRKVEENPGPGWCPVYVDEVKLWLA